MAIAMTPELEAFMADSPARDAIRKRVYEAFGIENLDHKAKRTPDEESALARKLTAAMHCRQRGHPPQEWGEDTKDGKPRLWFVDDGGNKLEICAKD